MQGSVPVLCNFIMSFLFFRFYFVDINVVCKLRIRFDKKKNEQVCKGRYFWGHIRIVYKISGLKTLKILTSKLKFLR